jgi:hypothetical protein
MTEYVRSNKTTFEDFTARVRAWNDTLADVTAPYGAASYKEDRLIVKESNPLFGEVSSILIPTRTAQAQLGERLHFPPGWVFNADPAQCTPEIRAQILNSKFMDAKKEEPMLWRTRGGEVLRAVLSNRYARYDNIDLWSAIDNAATKAGLRELAPVVFRPYVGDKMTAYIIFPTVTADTNNANSYDTGHGRRDDGGLHPAIYISNAEDGTGSTNLSGGLYRSVCENGCIYGWHSEASIKIRHRAHSDVQMAYAVSVAIVEAMKNATLGMEAYVKACTMEIETAVIPNIVAEWKSKFAVSENVTKQWLDNMTVNASVHPLTLADAVNSLTFIGGAIEDADARENVEIAAGELLAVELPPTWRRR